MFYTDAGKQFFELVTVFGHPMIFSSYRIDRKTVPEGFYVYEIRHDDECAGDPVEISEHILVNFWGTVISNVPVEMTESSRKGKPFRVIDPEKEWNYEREYLSVMEYMENYPLISSRIAPDTRKGVTSFE